MKTKKKVIPFILFLLIPGLSFANRMPGLDDYAWFVFIFAFILGIIIATTSVLVIKKNKPQWSNSRLFRVWMTIFSSIIVVPLILTILLF